PASGTNTIDIAKADATVKTDPYSGTYDGSAHGINGSAKGVVSEDLSSLLDLGATDTDAGHYTANWTVAGNIDYNSASGSNTIDIGVATVTGHITAKDRMYDGTTTVTLTSETLTGTIGSDDVSLTVGSASFDSKTVGSDGVTATGLGL